VLGVHRQDPNLPNLSKNKKRMAMLLFCLPRIICLLDHQHLLSKTNGTIRGETTIIIIREIPDREEEDTREMIDMEGEEIISSSINRMDMEDIHRTTFNKTFPPHRLLMVIGVAVLVTINSNIIAVNIHRTTFSKIFQLRRLLKVIGVVVVEGEDMIVGGEGLLLVEDTEEEGTGDGIKISFENKRVFP